MVQPPGHGQLNENLEFQKCPYHSRPLQWLHNGCQEIRLHMSWKFKPSPRMSISCICDKSRANLAIYNTVSLLLKKHVDRRMWALRGWKWPAPWGATSGHRTAPRGRQETTPHHTAPTNHQYQQCNQPLPGEKDMGWMCEMVVYFNSRSVTCA